MRLFAVAVLTIVCWSSLAAYKVAYAIPTSNSNAQHEVWTARALYHLCISRGVWDLELSPLYRALFEKDLVSCSDIAMEFDPNQFVPQVQASPVAGLMLGSRWPDLMEMAGVDADMQDLTIVKYSDQAQFDTYRIYPHLHCQLSKYLNIFGGDPHLGIRAMRDYVRSLFYESLMLMLSYDRDDAPPNWFTAYSNFQHDTGLGGPDYWFDVPWHTILLGRYSHMTADGFSHDPVRPLDVAEGRIPHGSLFYGKFETADQRIVTAGDAEYRDAIHPDLGATLGDFGALTATHSYTPYGPLDLADIPAMEGAEHNYFADAAGRRFMAGRLSTTLSMYSFYEFIEALIAAAERLDDPAAVAALIDAYIDKWWDDDFAAVAGFTAVAVQDVGAQDPRYLELPWHQYHFVDIWEQSGHTDVTVDRYGAFIMPWTDRASMGDKLQDEALYGRRFVLLPDDTEQWDEEKRILHVDRAKLYLFRSWHRVAGNYLSFDLDPSLYFSGAGDTLAVAEKELDPDTAEAGDSAGLNRPFAFAYVPPGWRLCLHHPGDPNGKKGSIRTDWYDSRKEFYRCFYGTAEGEAAQVNFHLRAGTRLYLLPIDADGDGVPFLRGLRDDIYADNCPLDHNPDQSLAPCIEEEDGEEDEEKDIKNEDDIKDDEGEREDSVAAVDDDASAVTDDEAVPVVDDALPSADDDAIAPIIEKGESGCGCSAIY